MRKHDSFNNDWYFSFNDTADACGLFFDHSCWQSVTLPHDFSVGYDYEKNAPTGTRGGFNKSGVGIYRKGFYVTDNMLSKHIEITFDGVFMNSEIYINGEKIYNRPYGYISFNIDITKYLIKGYNIIAVRVDCEKQTQTRWYSGGGIYRNTWLTQTENVAINTWGTFIRTASVKDDIATINYDVEINNRLEQTMSCTVISTVYDDNSNICKQVSKEINLAKGETLYKEQFELNNCKLWSPEQPNLYTIETVISDSNMQEIDRYNTTFGVRITKFVPNEGFFLNGKNYKFKGVCLHHDGGVVGVAVPDSIWKKRLALLKEMGCNSVRTAHNPFSPEFYNICDQMGIMVMDEIFDGWDTAKAPYDYGLYFNDYHEIDSIDFIKRDRNHPSVVIWSIGNEVRNMKPELTKKLQDIFHKYDESRAVTCGIQGVSEESDKNRAVLDVAGYNDGGGACFSYEGDHQKRPNQLMIATEAPHTFQTRGHYRTQTWWRDKNQPRIEIENLTEEEIFFDGRLEYASSYDNHGVRVCARDSYSIVERLPYLCGEFRWTGIDYIGETFRWPSIKSDNGVIDTANFKKDHFYLYQSMWVDKTEKPMVHILPHWTHNTLNHGTIIPVWVYTNCDEVELLLNDNVIGRQARDSKKNLQFNVPYSSGTLTAVAYIDGKVACKTAHTTASYPQKVLTTSDFATATFNGLDTVQLDFIIADECDIMVPYANNTLHFDVYGNAEFVGTDNGNCIDHTLQTSKSRRAFNGLVACTIKLADSAGDVAVRFAAILGDKIFSERTVVSIATEMVGLNCGIANEDIQIYYHKNSKSSEKTLYQAPFEVDESTAIYAEVYIDNVLVFDMCETFMKGELAPVIDLAHGNKILDTATPVGPFAEKMNGSWSDGQFDLLFNADGTLDRRVNESITQPLGHWWYDYPIDFLEAPDYAGMGEIWLNTGEKLAISMLTQEAVELKVDNKSAAFSTAFGYQETLILQKKV